MSTLAKIIPQCETDSVVFPRNNVVDTERTVTRCSTAIKSAVDSSAIDTNLCDGWLSCTGALGSKNLSMAINKYSYICVCCELIANVTSL